MKTIRFGNEDWVIHDEGATTPLIDWITEARLSDGIVYLGLGSSQIDAANKPEVQVRARPRMTLQVARQLHAALGRLISEAEGPSRPAT